MITTIEFVIIVVLVIILGFVIWNLVVELRYSSYLASFVTARGANGVDGDSINLQCEPGKNICIYRATQICTNPDPSTNYETSNLEPISNTTNYGDFNPLTTVDLTQDMITKCKGNSCTYNFKADWSSLGVECQGQSQLIATYSCVANDSDCNSWSPASSSTLNSIKLS